MRFLFSNRRLWHTYYGILMGISVLCILLAFLSYRSFPALRLCLALSIASAVLALKMTSLYSNCYLIFDRTHFEIHGLFSKEINSYRYEELKYITKNASLVEIQFGDGKKALIHLEYLNPEDVGRLLKYLRFHPMIGSSKKSFL